jgi:hypothetical protein
MDAERVKPLTMTQEREDTYRSLTEASGRRGHAVSPLTEGALCVWEELDATRSQLAALTESHAACVRAIRSTQWEEDDESGDLYCCECYGDPKGGHRAGCSVLAALSDPLSLAVEDK